MTRQITKPLEDLFDQLDAVLNRMEYLIRKSDFDGVEMLCQKADLIIARLDDMRLSGYPELKTRCKQVLGRYERLVLMLRSAQAAIYQQMHKLENGKKIIQAYNGK
ncbi:MAG TPA: hypothetical protein PK052_02220 [Anaerohalosphaeraceae bacterium]|nr:hypothetical protein [Phycisphaerae bacterium]HOK94923.1 hypothetical protein [Anaerohalosphaeraceae bacterium]HOL30771.1 hypothetical protein [Anaerohalosphaeraceae bacterium]HOM75414.1 hypothetical protein [Anaerohalosphaeraceae bacterium]HPC63026.1 hypothetical protein [Anaerohalosphaeraceae bacterium]